MISGSMRLSAKKAKMNKQPNLEQSFTLLPHMKVINIWVHIPGIIIFSSNSAFSFKWSYLEWCYHCSKTLLEYRFYKTCLSKSKILHVFDYQTFLGIISYHCKVGAFCGYCGFLNSASLLFCIKLREYENANA